ncbi:cysteine synthase A [bacterium]|nr:cysteine synthase A [bacterium]
MKIYSDITKTIGNTPLVKMQRLDADSKAEIYLKLEFFNPLGSVKDRIGMNMIEAAEKSGALKAGMEIIEPTSGNTGIALAFVAAAKGYKLTLVMPETMSQERRTLLLLLGAEIVLTPGANGMRGAIAKALQMTSENKNAFYPSQFTNVHNPQIHRQTTAEEIWNDTDGKVDIVVSGVGTAGTITGVGQVLKKKKASVRMVAVEPTESPVLSGGKGGPHKIQGLGAGFIPRNYDRSVVDQVEQVSSEESLAMAREVIKKEGIPVGISSGAAVHVALKLGSLSENKGKVIVAIIPSYTERYLSTLLAQPEREKAAALIVEPVADEWLKKVDEFCT